MRLLAIDLGQRRTGLAMGDDETGLVTPAGVLACRPGADAELLVALGKAVSDHDADAIVIGLPLNMDGTEGPPAKAIRAFGERLAAFSGRPVHFQDERLTSFAADGRLAGSGRTRGEKKKVRDALAAVEILADYLRARDGLES